MDMDRYGSPGDCEEFNISCEIQSKPYFRFQNEEYPFNAEIALIMKHMTDETKKLAQSFRDQSSTSYVEAKYCHGGVLFSCRQVVVD